jgi:stage III sporulation protein AA
MLSFLPKYIQNALKHVPIQYLYELRLRVDKPIMANYKGNFQYLSALGITNSREKALRCSDLDIEDCVYRAGNFSVYSVEEQIKQGFITAKGGIRLGLAGEYVLEKGKVHAIRNFTSLCIRIPHEVYGCAQEIYDRCMSDKIRNLLIASPPGLGKTTILRDLGRIIGKETRKNILICDERGEISIGNVGEYCDIIKYLDKTSAFEAGVRAMRPDIIITDELSERDCIALQKAMDAGVNVVATAHFSDISYVKAPFIGLFEQFVFLDTQEIGKVMGIYNQIGEVIV